MATTINFPSQLPAPKRSGYGLKPVSTFARTTMASGRAKQRPMHRTVPTMVPVTWTLTQEQAQIFEAWFNYDADYGAAWFNCTLDSPVGLRLYECRFVDMYEGPKLYAHNHWQYSAQLEMIERPIITEDWYRNGLQYIQHASLFDLAINREWPAA